MRHEDYHRITLIGALVTNHRAQHVRATHYQALFRIDRTRPCIFISVGYHLYQGIRRQQMDFIIPPP